MQWVKLLSVVIWVGFCSPGHIWAQDPVFSQAYASNLMISPCFSGFANNFMATAQSRSQWAGVHAVPYVTHHLSALKTFYNSLETQMLGGMGLNLYSDRMGNGSYQRLGAYLNGAYNLKIAENNYLALGIKAGMVQKQIKPDHWQWGSQYSSSLGYDPAKYGDVLQGNLHANIVYPDIGSGLMYYLNPNRDTRGGEGKAASAYLGYSAMHINRANVSLIEGGQDRLALFHQAMAGLEFTLGGKLNIAPQGIYSHTLARSSLVTGGLITFLIDRHGDFTPSPVDLMLGGYYRSGDAVITMIGLGSSYYKLGFSYDFNVSELSSLGTSRGNAWEISFQFIKPKKIIRNNTPM